MAALQKLPDALQRLAGKMQRVGEIHQQTAENTQADAAEQHPNQVQATFAGLAAQYRTCRDTDGKQRQH